MMDSKWWTPQSHALRLPRGGCGGRCSVPAGCPPVSATRGPVCSSAASSARRWARRELGWRSEDGAEVSPLLPKRGDSTEAETCSGCEGDT